MLCVDAVGKHVRISHIASRQKIESPKNKAPGTEQENRRKTLTKEYVWEVELISESVLGTAEQRDQSCVFVLVDQAHIVNMA